MQKWEGSNLSNSIASESGSTLTVAGTLNAAGGVAGLQSANVTTALGYTPANKAGETFTGTVTAPAFVGSGAGLTGIGAETGGVINTGSTTVGADSDADGVGAVSIPTRGAERVGVANDGTVNFTGGVTANGVTMIAPAWNAKGTVLAASGAADSNNLLEPTVIYEGSPQLLTGYARVFKMWFTGGWSPTVNTYYAESPNGISWTRRAPAVVPSCIRSYVTKQGATYYLFCSAQPGESQINLYTSADGVTFALATARVLTPGASYDADGIANIAVRVEGSTWYMLYEGRSGGQWKISVATAPAAAGPYTKSASNPVITIPGGGVGGPSPIAKVGSTYYVWVHRSASGDLPTDIYRYHSTDLITWTQSTPGPAIPRLTADEGVGRPSGQTADPTWVEANGQVYMWYSATPDGATSAGGLRIKLAVSPRPLAQLVETAEGVNPATAGLGPTNAAPPVLYNSSGTAFPGYRILHGGVLLSGGTGTVTISGAAAFTSSSTYVCTFGNNTAANPVYYTRTSGSQFVVNGTGTNAINYICIGN